MIFLGDCAELIKSLDYLPARERKQGDCAAELIKSLIYLPARERKQDIPINGAIAILQDILNLSKNNSFSYYSPYLIS